MDNAISQLQPIQQEQQQQQQANRDIIQFTIQNILESSPPQLQPYSKPESSARPFQPYVQPQSSAIPWQPYIQPESSAIPWQPYIQPQSSAIPWQPCSEPEYLQERQKNDIPMRYSGMPTPQPLPRAPLEDVEGCYSFVDSLYLNDYGSSQCHPLAAFYIKHFTTQRESLLKNLYDYLNAKVFGNLLPWDLKISFHPQLWESTGCTFPYSDWRAEIYLSVRHNETPWLTCDTLLHELCHVAAHMLDHDEGEDDHGELFQKWADHVNHILPNVSKVEAFYDGPTYTNFLLQCSKCQHMVGKEFNCGNCRNCSNCSECGGENRMVHIYDPTLFLVWNAVKYS